MDKASKKILGLPVFSIKEGQKLGQVKDIIINHEDKSIAGLIIQTKGMFREDKIIPYGKIKNVGHEAIIVETHTSLERKANLPQIVDALNNPMEILGLKIITEGGISLGRVSEYYFNTETGNLSSLEISGSIVEGFLKGQTLLDFTDVIIIGKDAVITKDNVGNIIKQEDKKSKNHFSTLSELKSSTAKGISSVTSKGFDWLKEKKSDEKTNNITENLNVNNVFHEMISNPDTKAETTTTANITANAEEKSTSDNEMDLDNLIESELNDIEPSDSADDVINKDNNQTTDISETEPIEKTKYARIKVNIL